MPSLNNIQMPVKSTAASDLAAVQLGQVARQLPQVPVSQQRGVIQTAAAQVTAQEGATKAKELKEAATSALQQRAEALTQEQLRLQQVNAEKALALSQQTRELEQSLANTDRQLYNQVYNDSMKFERDELERVSWNNRQLSDWAVLKARNEEELRDYESMMSQAAKRRSAVHEQALKLMQMRLQQEYNKYTQLEEQRLKKEQAGLTTKFEEIRLQQTEALTTEINNYINQLNQKMAEDAARDAMNGGIFEIATGVLGGAIGLIATGGSPMGAAAGLSIGSSLGKAGYAATK